MTALVLTSFHGRVHIAVDHTGPSSEAHLGEELKRVTLTEAQSALPIRDLQILFAAQINEAREKLTQ